LELDAPSTPSIPTATVESNVDDEVVPLPVFTNDPYSEHDPVPDLIHDHVVVDAMVRDGIVATHFTVVDVDRSSRGIPVEVTPPNFSIRLHVGCLHRAATIEVDNVIQTVERGGIAAVGELVAEDEEIVSKSTKRSRGSAAKGRLNLGPDDAPVIRESDRLGCSKDHQLCIGHPVAAP